MLSFTNEVGQIVELEKEHAKRVFLYYEAKHESCPLIIDAKHGLYWNAETGDFERVPKPTAKNVKPIDSPDAD